MNRIYDIWYALLCLMGLYGTYIIRNEVHIFWVIMDVVAWIIIGFAPAIWRFGGKDELN